MERVDLLREIKKLQAHFLKEFDGENPFPRLIKTNSLQSILNDLRYILLKPKNTFQTITLL